MWSYLQGVCIDGALGDEERITCVQTFLLPFFSRESHDVKLTNNLSGIFNSYSFLFPGLLRRVCSPNADVALQ